MCERKLEPLRPLTAWRLRGFMVVWGGVTLLYAYLPIAVMGHFGLWGAALLPMVALPAWFFYGGLKREERDRDRWPRIQDRLGGRL